MRMLHRKLYLLLEELSLSKYNMVKTFKVMNSQMFIESRCVRFHERCQRPDWDLAKSEQDFLTDAPIPSRLWVTT